MKKQGGQSVAVKFIAVKCPSCGANLPIEEGRTEMFCSCCGAKIIMTNENEHIYRHVDEAEIKKAEAEKDVQLKKLEILEKRRASADRVRKIKILVSVILGLISIVSLGIGAATETDAGYMVGLMSICILGYMWMISMGANEHNENDVEVIIGEKVRIPKEIDGFEGKDYMTIQSLFYQAGFSNVRCIPLHDVRIGLLKKPGNVKSITVNGKAITAGGKKVMPDSTVVISYHSMV